MTRRRIDAKSFPVRLVWTIAGALLLPAMASPAHAQVAAVIAQAPDSPHYYYFDERVDLPLDRTRLAVRTGKAESPDATELSRLVNVLIEVNPWAVEGWSLAEAGRALTDAELAALAERLLRTHAFVSPVFLGLDGGVLFATENILVQFIEEFDRRQAVALFETLGPIAILDERWGGLEGAYRVALDVRHGEDVLRVANALARHPATIFAEPEMMFTGRPTLIPNDPGFVNLWGMLNPGHAGGIEGMDMKATYAWDMTLGEPGVSVMVIDVGVDPDHPDLNVAPGADFTGQGGAGAPVNDCDNHGTPVAGCISAIINNNLGTVGIAPNCPAASARCLISLPACDGSWAASAAWTVEALDWAEANGVRVTNNSNEYGFMSSAIAQRYATTRDGGMIHFASSGNGAARALTYPGSLPSVNAIGAIGRDGEKASFSNFHANLAMVAPGRDIYTTDRTGTRGWASGDFTFTFGTSFASPYAAGVAALVLSCNPSLTAPEVEDILKTTARDLGEAGKDELYGCGLVNAFKAVMAAQTCYADCDHDSVLTIFDYLCFQDHYFELSAYADCNTDGTLTLDDYLCFQDAFLTGCP